MSFLRVEEEAVVGRKGDRVVKGWIGQPSRPLAIEADAMQLRLQGIVSAPGQVIDHTGSFIYVHHVADVEAMFREGPQQSFSQVV